MSVKESISGDVVTVTGPVDPDARDVTRKLMEDQSKTVVFEDLKEQGKDLDAICREKGFRNLFFESTFYDLPNVDAAARHFLEDFSSSDIFELILRGEVL